MVKSIQKNSCPYMYTRNDREDPEKDISEGNSQKLELVKVVSFPLLVS